MGFRSTMVVFYAILAFITFNLSLFVFNYFYTFAIQFNDYRVNYLVILSALFTFALFVLLSYVHELHREEKRAKQMRYRIMTQLRRNLMEQEMTMATLRSIMLVARRDREIMRDLEGEMEYIQQGLAILENEVVQSRRHLGE